MQTVCVCWLLCALTIGASETYPPARFSDPQRNQKLASAFPAIDRIFQAYAVEHKIPGLVWGVVVDSALSHTGSAGVQDRKSNARVTEDTVFRIASMTKSFTVLAILRLRDQGKLSLEDPVANWIPEFRSMALPTRDTAPLTVRQLLMHNAGFPEDNPWGDQQLSASEDDLTHWLQAGIPFSTAPGTRYEYSNYAFGLLGRIVSKVSGVPYERYVESEILQKLHMDSSTFDSSRVPNARRAVGYRLQPDGAYEEEPPLPRGAFSAAGALLTNAEDLGKYVAFQLSAWPPRDELETGPVRRSSVREMNHLWNPSNLTVGLRRGLPYATETGYGYGLRISTDCRFEHIVGHGGGLPGFGSYMAWLPEYGVGIFATANLTYAGPAEPINRAWDELLSTGGLQRRVLPPSPMLAEMRSHLVSLWQSWNDAEAREISAMNFFLDVPLKQRRTEMEELKKGVGTCEAGPVLSENWLRGQFNMTCQKGSVGVFFTLAPTQPPKLQHLSYRKIESVSVRMGAPTGAPAGVSCSQ